jgi:hypothetical protein
MGFPLGLQCQALVLQQTRSSYHKFVACLRANRAFLRGELVRFAPGADFADVQSRSQRLLVLDA